MKRPEEYYPGWDKVSLACLARSYKLHIVALELQIRLLTMEPVRCGPVKFGINFSMN